MRTLTNVNKQLSSNTASDGGPFHKPRSMMACVGAPGR